MLKRNSSSNWALYLCQSFPRHTETVFLHPLSSQRTSTQWEFRTALFLLPLLLCRKQRAFSAQTGSSSCKVPTSACFHRCLKIHLHKFGKFEMGLNCKVTVWFVLAIPWKRACVFTCLTLHLWACCERSLSPLFAGNMGCRRCCQRWQRQSRRDWRRSHAYQGPCCGPVRPTDTHRCFRSCLIKHPRTCRHVTLMM